ncbi:MAG TPA: hypothetical protein PLS95_08765 [Thermoanaerobaculales bacterium]|nr:hypothetical protein [Thermoanaerobaculales bacterium]HQN96197.1 hypothetical protein [Thermoanaerobaculales bacterium]HQP43408.1 hypothetical protein [Thermoanaerobaculales bacterium]
MRFPKQRLRRWLVGIAIACVALELVYVVTAHFLLKGDTLTRLISKKPEKMRIEWKAARSWFPGVVTVEQLTIRGQSRRIQWYLAADDVHARISLVRLALKRVHLGSAEASGIDFRLRRRLDPPVKEGAEGVPKEIRGSEHFPEIPGFSNPPDPKPEDLYPRKKKLKKPWVIHLGGIDVDGPVRVAAGRMRLAGDGVVSGAMTYRLRDTIEVRRGNLRLTNGQLTIDSELASDDLNLDVSSRFRSFPAKGAKLPQILAGASGSFAIAGNIRSKASVPIELVPGLPISGTGRLDITLRLRDGVLQPDSAYTFDYDSFRVGVLGLTAAGSAKLAGTTRSGDNQPVTELTIDVVSPQFLSSADEAVGIEGSSLRLHALWDGQSLAQWKKATFAEIELPSAQIRDISVIGRLLPPQWGFGLASGTGTLSGRLSVDADRQASGQLDLESRQLRVSARGIPMRADLGVHATLTRGDLPGRVFEVAETTITIDDAQRDDGQERKGGSWWCSLKLTNGNVTFGRPIAATGAVAMKLRDTRPIVAIINEFSKPPKWMSLLPEIENVDGSLELDMDGARTALNDADITGQSLQMLGWLHLVGKRADGRIYVKYKGMAAGIGLDGGKSSIHLAKPRQWFDEQPTGSD